MLGVGAGIVVVMMALVSWNSKYHRSFHVDVNENRNWNILMFLCQPIFLNLRHIFEDFLLTALIKKSEYDSKLTKYNILWNIQFLFRKRRGLFSELAYQYFCQICSNDHTSELRNSSTFHNHYAVFKFWKRSLSSLPDPIIVCPWSFIRSLLLLRQWWCDSGWEEETNLILNNFSMLMLRLTCIVTQRRKNPKLSG